MKKKESTKRYRVFKPGSGFYNLTQTHWVDEEYNHQLNIFLQKEGEDQKTWLDKTPSIDNSNKELDHHLAQLFIQGFVFIESALEYNE